MWVESGRSLTETTARPVWFGGDHPLFGFLHYPLDGRVRGGVVICPSLGAELFNGHPALRDLAERAAAAGFAALRFDYAGTGDSSGALAGPEAVSRLRDSVRQAAFALLAAGVPTLALAGLRIGATLAAEAAVDLPAEVALALVDPCADGSRFLREQTARYRLTVGEAPDDGGVHSVTFAYPAEVAADLRAVRLPPPAALQDRRTAVVVRASRREGTLGEFAAAAGATVLVTDEMADLLDVSTVERRLPTRTVAAVVTWLAESLDAAPAVLDLGGFASAATVAPGVRETFERLGPVGLFGIRTVPEPPVDAPPIVFLNTSTEQHIGPGRMWVDLAREWATAGREVVRVDLAGIGDSPGHPDRPALLAYAPEHLTDIVDIARALSPQAPDQLIPVGLCSGAVHALEWAVRVGAPEAVAINPILSLALDEAEIGDPPVERYVSQVVSSWLRGVHDDPRFAGLKRGLPPIGWRLLDRLRVHRSPTAGLERVVARGARVLMIAGPEDAYAYQHRGAGALRRLARSGRFELRVVDGVDHALQAEPARAAVARLLSEWVLGSQPAPDPDLAAAERAD